MALEKHQIEILEVISDLNQVSIKGLLECVIYTEERSILKEDMEALHEAGLINRQGNGMWNLTKQGKKMLKHSAENSTQTVNNEPKPTSEPEKFQKVPAYIVPPKVEPAPTTEEEELPSVAAENLELIQLRKDNAELRQLLRIGRDELAASYAAIKNYQSTIEAGEKLQFASGVRDRISLNTKIQVLEALSVLVAEDIAEVLDNIKQDITPE